MPSDHTDRLANQATKLALTGFFLGAIAWFSARLGRRGEDARPSPFELVQVGLAAYRTGRVLAYERIAAPLREPFTETRPDVSGYGETVVAAGSGVRRALGELLSCPVCISTWASAALVFGLHLAPRPTRVYLAIMSATGVAELAWSASEALGWLGRAARRGAAR